MQTKLATLAIVAAFAAPTAAHATDLSVSYKSSATGSQEVAWTFHDVKPGDLPAITVDGPTGTPVRIAVHVAEVSGDKVKANAEFYEIRTNLYGKESAELLLRQELSSAAGTPAGAKVVMDSREAGSGFTLKVTAEG